MAHQSTCKGTKYILHKQISPLKTAVEYKINLKKVVYRTKNLQVCKKSTTFVT